MTAAGGAVIRLLALELDNNAGKNRVGSAGREVQRFKRVGHTPSQETDGSHNFLLFLPFLGQSSV